jgi:ATP-dependent RNA helicase SUPV3L1/SUV3
VARLTKGTDLLHPEVRLVVADDAGAGARAQLLRRLVAWSRDMVGELLAPLRQPLAEDLSPAARGLVYQLEQGLGTTGAWSAREQIQHLTRRDRDLLARLDVNVGRRVIYVRGLLKPRRIRQRLALCAAQVGNDAAPRLSAANMVSLPVDSAVSPETYLAVGYPAFGPRAIRADLAERTHRRLDSLARRGPFELPREVAAWLGCPARDLPPVLEGFGYQRNREGLYLRARRPRSRRAREARHTLANGRTDARRPIPRSDDGAGRRAR